MAGKSPELTESDLHNWELVRDFRDQLEKSQQSFPLHPTFNDPRRRLLLSDYLTLFLFGLLNPVVRTMRALCAASHLPAMRKQICQEAVSLGSFSETQHVLDPALLERIFNDLAERLPPVNGDAVLGQWQWLAQDSSLFAALPRMTWALYGGGNSRNGCPSQAVRLHLSLNILDDKPQRAVIRPGKQCERKVWREQWQRGQAYVGDRNYGQDHKLFQKLDDQNCAFVLRLREQQVVIKVLEELPLSNRDRQQGVFRQAWAILGSRPRYQSMRVRLVWIQTQDGPLILVTNLDPERLPAEFVSILYRKRWRIELFFRWIKCILGCRHFLAESPQGVAIQIYLALIAALLLQLYTGQRPNKRLMELIQFYLLGVASVQDLRAGLEREKSRQKRQKSK